MLTDLSCNRNLLSQYIMLAYVHAVLWGDRVVGTVELMHEG